RQRQWRGRALQRHGRRQRHAAAGCDAELPQGGVAEEHNAEHDERVAEARHGEVIWASIARWPKRRRSASSTAGETVPGTIMPPTWAVSRTKLLDRYTFLALVTSNIVGKLGAS